jgi:hypothetical protein
MSNRGEAIWFEHWGKVRPGVVLRVCANGRLLVIAGSTRPPATGERAVRITAESYFGRMLGLSETTWFKEQAVAMIQRNAATSRCVGGHCPTGLLIELDKVVGLG